MNTLRCGSCSSTVVSSAHCGKEVPWTTSCTCVCCNARRFLPHNSHVDNAKRYCSLRAAPCFHGYMRRAETWFDDSLPQKTTPHNHACCVSRAACCLLCRFLLCRCLVERAPTLAVHCLALRARHSSQPRLHSSSSHALHLPPPRPSSSSVL